MEHDKVESFYFKRGEERRGLTLLLLGCGMVTPRERYLPMSVAVGLLFPPLNPATRGRPMCL
jgi:hypothetical protein